MVDIATAPDFMIRGVRCTDDHRRWSVAEQRGGYGVVLVRSGRFRRLTGGVASDVDPTRGFVMRPGDEERFAHPAGGDVCTWVDLSPGLWHGIAADIRPDTTIFVDARLDLGHRRLLAAARAGDVGFGVAEGLVGTLAYALRLAPPVGSARDRPMVAAAREAIATDHPAAAGLLPLAGLLGVSPYRLSRAFTRETGVSLTHYRNRVRVGRALDHLEAGGNDLAALAADLGFADQSHLCRTIRAHLGHTPTEVRRLLAPDNDVRTARTEPVRTD